MHTDYNAFDQAAWPHIDNVQLEAMLWDELSTEQEALCRMLVCLNTLYRRNLHVQRGFASLNEYLMNAYNLSKQQAWMRAAVAKVLHTHPKLLEMLQSSEACLSNVAMIAGKLTNANAGMLYHAAATLSKRALEAYLLRVGADGSLAEAEDMVTISVMVPRKSAELLDQIVALLSVNRAAQRGAVSKGQAVIAALDVFLDKHDPERKATRALARSSRKQPPPAQVATKMPANCPEADAPDSRESARKRQPIPQATRHAVFLRDGNRCCWQEPEGQRCQATRYLQIDHIKMVAEGGDNAAQNLRQLCAAHNRWAAERHFGRSEREA